MKGVLHILDPSGHTDVSYDTEVNDGPLAPEVAEQRFNEMVDNGMFAFATTETGKNEQIKEFAPHPEITITPAFRGG